MTLTPHPQRGKPVTAYFGNARSAPAWRDMHAIDVPVGKQCVWCSESIELDDDGILDGAGEAWHGDCWVRQVCGGVNHINGTCSCRGGTDSPDPPNLTLRQAATAAVQLFEEGRL